MTNMVFTERILINSMFSMVPNIVLAPNMTQNAERKHRTQDTNTANFRSSSQMLYQILEKIFMNQSQPTLKEINQRYPISEKINQSQPTLKKIKQSHLTLKNKNQGYPSLKRTHWNHSTMKKINQKLQPAPKRLNHKLQPTIGENKLCVKPIRKTPFFLSETETLETLDGCNVSTKNDTGTSP